MARSGIVWHVLRLVVCPFKKYESERESDIYHFQENEAFVSRVLN